jgi:predicted nuclease with RNAse H fold
MIIKSCWIIKRLTYKYIMIVIGIDLAGSEKNATGFCILKSDGKSKILKTMLLRKDEDIIFQCDLLNPDLIAIDAPLTPARNAYMRPCDEELAEYGALPHSLRGMAYLVERGLKLGNALKSKHKVIEVYNNATAKILGYHDKKDIDMQKHLAHMLGGELKERIMKRDELDAISAALTGFLYLQGKTVEEGDEEGKITIPKV